MFKYLIIYYNKNIPGTLTLQKYWPETTQIKLNKSW